MSDSVEFDDAFDADELRVILEGNVDMNFLSPGMVAVKYVFFFINIILCIVCAAWTILHRNQWIVIVGQPRILLSIIAGCFLSSLALIFAGAEAGFRYVLDDSTGEIIENPEIHRADAFCATVPFLFFIGTGITTSMLITKLRHVHMIHQASIEKSHSKLCQQFKEISFREAAWVVGSIMFVKLLLNIIWLTYDPIRWVRSMPTLPTENYYFPMQSYGYCGSETYNYFSYSNIAFDIVLSFYVIVLCWKTRGFDDPYTESKYIFFAVLFQFECMVLSIPLWEFMELDHQLENSQLLILIVYLFVFPVVILGLLFIPKMIKLQKQKRGKDLRKKKTIPVSALTNSKWDKAVDNINRLLDEDRDPYHAMTEEQRNALESAKRILLKGPNYQNRRKIKFIPKNLIRECLIEDISPTGTIRYGTLKKSIMNDTPRFLMSVYGGINVQAFRELDDSMTCDDDENTFFSNGEIDVENNNNHNNHNNKAGSNHQQSSYKEETASDFDYIPKEFHALSKEDKLSLCKLLSWKELNRWDYDIFELNKVSGGHPLLFMGYALLGSPHSYHAMSKDCGAIGSDVTIDDLEGYHFVTDDDLKIPMRKLCNYLRVIEEDYISTNPYHNEIHGADVVQSLHVLLQMKGDILRTSNEDLFSILFSAVVHDVNHPGENNAFQKNSETKLALVYNDISILENRHASHAFMKMLTTGASKTTPKGGPRQSNNGNELYHGKTDSDINLLCNVSEAKLAHIRKRVINAVLHTDMSLHFQSVGELKALVASGGLETDEGGRWKVLQYMLHLADISNPAKPKQLALLWTDRCLEEFFAQGDKEYRNGLEVSPNCDRKTTKKPDSQIGFINFVIKPAYELLGDIIPSVKEEIVTKHIEANLQYWQKEKELATKKEKEMTKKISLSKVMQKKGSQTNGMQKKSSQTKGMQKNASQAKR